MLEPAGRRAACADELMVDFDLFLNPDGSVAQPPQLAANSAAAAAGDPYTRAAAEAARRAIYTVRLTSCRRSVTISGARSTFHFDPRK